MKHAPQIIYIFISIIGLMSASYLHGKPKTGKHSVWTTIVSVTIGLTLLYWGGFFDSLLS